MARAGWYNENEYRDYPFRTRVNPLEYPAGETSEGAELLATLPHEAIVDFVAIFALDAQFDEDAGHLVYLHSVRREDPYLYYTFRNTAPKGLHQELVFRRDPTSDPPFSSEWVSGNGDFTSSASATLCAESRWEGCLVTGRYDELLELLSEGEELIFEPGLWEIEPARIQSLHKSYLRSVSLGNFARDLALPPNECDPGEQSDAIHVNATCLDGELQFKEGYNCTIRQDSLNNAIIIGATPGGGEGTPCTEIPLFEGETSPDGSPYLSGGPTCAEIVKTINGKGGRRLTIKSGPGFRVFGDPDDANTLVIDRQLQDFAVCFLEDSSLSLSEEG